MEDLSNGKAPVSKTGGSHIPWGFESLILRHFTNE